MFERSYFFRMFAKIHAAGFRASDVFTMTPDEFRSVKGLSAYNLVMIMKLQQMYKEANRNEQRKCRIRNN